MTCYARHEIAPGIHADIPHEHEAKELTMCEAEEALLRIAFEIELQWGAGRIDLGRLKGIATAGKCADHKETKAA